MSEKCPSAVTLGGVEMPCCWQKGHDGMHRAYTLWSDSGYIEWASGHDFEVRKSHLWVVPPDTTAREQG